MAGNDLLMRIRTLFDDSGLKQAQGSLSRLSTAMGGAGGAANMLGSALGLGVGAGALYMARQVGEATIELAKMGAQSMQMRVAFEDLATQAGGSADAMVAAIQRASAGTVSEMDAIAAANRGMMLGLGANADQWEQLVEVARYRARAMGMDMTQALSDISTGIGRESRLILDNLGIILDIDRVTAQYAATLGKTAEQLTAAERKQAILNGVITEGQGMIEKAGGLALTAAEQFQQLDAAIEDLKTAFAEDLAPAVAGAAAAISEALHRTAEDAKLAGAGYMSTRYGAIALAEEERRLALAILEQQGAIDPYEARLNELAAAHGRAEDAAAAQRQEIQRLTAAMLGIPAELGGIGLKQPGLLANERRPPRRAVIGAEAEEDLIEKGQAAQIYAERDARLEMYRDLADEQTKLQTQSAKDSVAAWESAYEDLKSTIRAALQATSVTPGDMAATEAGTYKDKWDEPARRLDAIARGGLAEIQAHPDWAKALMIPPEILSGNEAILKEWAAQQSNAYRNLERPDMVAANMDAIVEQVKAEILRNRAIEQSLDMIAKEVMAAMPGVMKEDVAAALGMEDTGVTAGEKLVAGMKDGVQQADMVEQVRATIESGTAAKADALKAAGKDLWDRVSIGIKLGMDQGDYAAEVARRVAPLVFEILNSKGLL